MSVWVRRVDGWLTSRPRGRRGSMNGTCGPSIDQELKALFEEYRALYSIATFRMAALDRRIPVTAGTMAAILSGLDVVSRDSQLLLLLGAPPALVWFVRATVNHARSFEDVLRRIEQIERSVNDLFGKPVLHFQSQHPSRARHIGGRTSRESVSAVLATSFLLLAAAAFRMDRAALLPPQIEPAYLGILGIVGVAIALESVRLRQYRYEPTLYLLDATK